jgi:uncharacterized membrane protein YphA (DoxX/SURF4 family)
MARPHTLPAARALALLRIVTGGILLTAAAGKLVWYKVGGAVAFPVTSAEWQHDLPARLAAWLQLHSEGVPAAVVRDLLLPNGTLVAGIIAWAQVAAGALLLLGLFTRGAAVMAGLVATVLALIATVGGGTDARPYILLVALTLAFIIGNAGETFGWDGVRRERRRDVLL